MLRFEILFSDARFLARGYLVQGEGDCKYISLYIES